MHASPGVLPAQSMKNLRRSLSATCLVTSLLISFSKPAVLARSVENVNRATSAGVLVGPCASAAAQGPNGPNDDYSNASIDPGTTMTPDGVTATATTVVFRNTVENTGAGDDAFIISTPLLAPRFTVEISDDFGEHYTMLDRWTSSLTLPVSYRGSTTFFVRITVPPGLKALTAFETIIRATSTIDPAVTNETIDRIYTGFIRLNSTARIVNAGGTDVAKANPGSEIEFAVTYTNISSAEGIGNGLLAAQNLVITENGNAAPNNWGSTTEHIVGAYDSQGGYIVGDREGSTILTDIVTTLSAGQSGIFRFKRRVK